MRIVRQRRPERYEVIDRRLLEDQRLSYRALGVLVYLLSRPDGWETNSTRLSLGRKEGRDAIRVALAEIKLAGYLKAERRQDTATGRWSTSWVIYDEPTTGFQASGIQASVS